MHRKRLLCKSSGSRLYSQGGFFLIFNVIFFLKLIANSIFKTYINRNFSWQSSAYGRVLYDWPSYSPFFTEDYIFIRPLQITGKCLKNGLKFHSQFNLAYVCAAAEKVISTLVFKLELIFAQPQHEPIKMV